MGGRLGGLKMAPLIGESGECHVEAFVCAYFTCELLCIKLSAKQARLAREGCFLGHSEKINANTNSVRKY